MQREREREREREAVYLTERKVAHQAAERERHRETDGGCVM